MAIAALWRQIARGLRGLFRPSVADRDVTDEVQSYLEQAAEAHRARGLSAEAALRAARIELGGETSVEEQVREYGWESTVETLVADLRFAARRLRAEPGFTAVTVLTLAVGIGATTAIFSAVSPILLEPLPYPESGRVAMVWETMNDGTRNQSTFGMYRALAERSRSFDAIAALRSWTPTMTGPGQPEQFGGQRVSASYFRVLGVPPVLGRDFEASEDRLNGANVVVLSDALWRRRFGADPAIIGRPITLDDNPFVVIGVMPPSFENVLSPGAELWTTLQYDMSQGRAWGHHLRTVARLRPGVAHDEATRELTALGQALLDEQHPETYGPTVSFLTTPLRDDLTSGVKRAMLAIVGAVTLVLVIACVNVTNLFLARGLHRRGEFALRAALGAGHRRLVRQLLTESLLLAVIGGAAGMAVAAIGVRALVALSPEGLPRLGEIAIDGAVFAFGLGVTTLIGLAVGVMPALQAARSDPHEALQHGSRRTAGGHRRTRGVLVVAEVALALVLLVSSGLLLRSLTRLFAVDSGFDGSRVLTMQIQTSGRRLSDVNATYQFFAEALQAVRSVPGVTAADYTSQLPLSGDFDLYGVRFDPSPPQDPGELRGTFRYAVSPGYLGTMGIPLRQGRMLEEHDAAGAPPVALISEALAKRRLPGLDPVGRHMTLGARPYEIVGVVGDVKQASLALNEAEAAYVPADQSRMDRALSLVVRARGDVELLAPAIRQAIWSVDKDQAIVRTATMEDLLAASGAERRFALILFEAFALAALVLAAAGIYGVLAGSVAERTRELGVRSALGATRGAILGLVVRQGATLTGIGVAVGLVGAVAASQFIATMLFDVSPLDVTTYAGVIVLLGAVSVVASAVPARRAAKIDPATTLRAE